MKYWTLAEWTLYILGSILSVLLVVAIGAAMYSIKQPPAPIDPKREYIKACNGSRDEHGNYSRIPNVASDNWREWGCEK